MLTYDVLKVQDSMQTLFPQGQFLDQTDVNRALFGALEKMHKDVIRTSASNQTLYEHVDLLRARVGILEEENMQLKALVDDRGGKRQLPKLNLAISDLDLNDQPTGALPTPSTVCTLRFPDCLFTSDSI